MKAIVQIAAAFAIASFSFGNSSAGIQDRIAGGGAHQASPMGSDANNEPPRTILVAEEQAAAKVLSTALNTAHQAGVDPAQLKPFEDSQEARKQQAKSADANALAIFIAHTQEDTNQVLQAISVKLSATKKAADRSDDPPLSIVAMSFAIALFVSAVGVLMAAIAARRRTERVLVELGLL